MRMWMVEPQLLCRKHLLGEHVELHMFVGTLNKNISIEGYLGNGLLEVHNIKSRHKALIKEMEARGMNHKSPLPDFVEFEAGKVDVDRSLRELRERCNFCAARQEKYLGES